MRLLRKVRFLTQESRRKIQDSRLENMDIETIYITIQVSDNTKDSVINETIIPVYEDSTDAYKIVFNKAGLNKK